MNSRYKKVISICESYFPSEDDSAIGVAVELVSRTSGYLDGVEVEIYLLGEDKLLQNTIDNCCKKIRPSDYYKLLDKGYKMLDCDRYVYKHYNTFVMFLETDKVLKCRHIITLAKSVEENAEFEYEYKLKYDNKTTNTSVKYC